MAVVLYKKQKQLIDFLRQYIQKYGHAPKLEEIAKALGVSSLATVHEHLSTLEKKGVVRRLAGVVRGVELLDQKIAFGEGGVEVPLFGYISAGQPIEPYTDPDATLSVAPFLLSGQKRSYVLQVKGNSMVEDGILDGDYVVCEEKETAENGEIVVALLENEIATLKKYFKEKDRVRLEPANTQMSPIYAKNVKIQGKVVGVIRKYR
jgi:repressor LexA